MVSQYGYTEVHTIASASGYRALRYTLQRAVLLPGFGSCENCYAN